MIVLSGVCDGMACFLQGFRGASLRQVWTGLHLAGLPGCLSKAWTGLLLAGLPKCLSWTWWNGLLVGLPKCLS